MIHDISLLNIIEWFEQALAVFVLLITLVFGVLSFADIFQLDLSQVDTFIMLLEHVLYVAIGIELARLLLDYSLETLVELLAFVIARKVLLIEGNFVAVLLAVVSLAILFFSRYYLLHRFEREADA